MALYSLGNKTIVGVPSIALEVISGANVGFRLLELCAANTSTATNSGLSLSMTSAASVTPTSPANLIAEDPGNNVASNTTTAVAWATAPTPNAIYFRRYTIQTTLGSGVIWNFPRGITALKGGSGANQSICLSYQNTAVAYETWVVVDE